MPEFTTPDITAAIGRPPGFFLSVRRDHPEVYIARGLIQEFDLSSGDRLVLAFDEDRRPWAGFIGAPDERQLSLPGARVAVYHYDGETDARTTSSKAAMHLSQYAPEDGRGRLYLSDDTEEADIDGHSVCLHRLIPEHTSDS